MDRQRTESLWSTIPLGGKPRIVIGCIAGLGLIWLAACASLSVGPAASPTSPPIATEEPAATRTPSPSPTPSPEPSATPRPRFTATPFLPTDLEPIGPENAARLTPLTTIRPQAPGMLLHAVLFSPDQTRLALQFAFYGSASRDREAYIEVWSLETGQRLFRGPRWTYPAQMFFLPSGELLVIPADVDLAQIWDAGTGAQVGSLPLPSADNVPALAGEGKTLIVGEHGDGFGIVRLLDIPSQQVIGTLNVPGDLIDLSGDGEYFAVITVSDQMMAYTRVYELARQAEVLMIPGGGTFAAYGPYLEYRRGDSVWVQNVRQGRIISYPRSDCAYASAAFSPNGLLFVVPRGERCDGLEVRDLSTGETIITLQGEPWHNKALFSPRGNLLALWYGNATPVALWGVRP